MDHAMLSDLHKPTLLGAVARYLKSADHRSGRIPPHHRVILARFASQWMLEGHSESLEAVDPGWVREYLESLQDPRPARDALDGFYQWAMQAGLAAESPLPDGQSLLEAWFDQLNGRPEQ